MKRSYKNIMDKCYDFDWYDTKNGKKFQKKMGHKRLRNYGDKDISERNKTDEIKFIDEIECDFITYHYRLAARLINNTLIINEYYDDKWYIIKEDYIPDDIERMELFEYIDKQSNSTSWTDPSLKHIKGENIDNV